MPALATFAAGIALATPAPAMPAHTAILRYTDGAPATTLQQWLDTSLAPQPGGTITIHTAPCFDGQPRSCTRNPGNEVWLDAPPEMTRWALQHELGHRFDYLQMNDSARWRFRQLIHDGRAWDSEPNAPKERFAEAYGVCSRHRSISDDHLAFGYGYDPTPRVHRRICRLIRQTAIGR